MAEPLRKLAARRVLLGLMRRDLAEKVGISHRTMSAIETGERNPSIQTLKKIAEALDCKVDDLI